jgi:hypothetical protein
MKKNKLIYNLLFAAGMASALFACSDDEGEGTTAGFAGISSNIYEIVDDGPLTVFIPYRDGSVSEGNVEISGTAVEGDDYTVSYADDGITVTVVDDVAAENIETIRFTIKGSTGTSNPTHTVRLVSDDPGYLDIALLWAAGPDMDLHLVYRANEEDAWHLMPGATTIFSAAGFSDPGTLRVQWTAADGQYGMAYNYYAGSVDPLAFSSRFTPTGTTVNGETTPVTFNSSITVAQQIDPGAIGDLYINQIFTKTGAAFTDFTPITTPPIAP